jgi:LysR family glycine cleavage system transcriptional activator
MINNASRRPMNVPLSALRVFEAAARQLNFKATAEELGLTPSAVSHQIRALEQHLECNLFSRGPKGVELTSNGQEYALEIIEAFDLIRNANAKLISGQTIVRLSAAPVFAQTILLRQLDDFEETHSKIDLRIEVSLVLANILRNEADVGVRFGNGRWPGLFSEKILDVKIVPVCSPKILLESGFPENITKHTLLSFKLTEGSWDSWFSMNGKPMPKRYREVWYDSLSAVLDAARDGHGVALAPTIFVREDIENGRLVFADSEVLPAWNGAYYLVCRKGEEELSRIYQTRLWLKKAVERVEKKSTL